MKVAVVVPFRGDDPYRARNWAWIRNHYETHHGWPIHVADNEGRWSKGAAIAAALEQCDADVLVLADADSFVHPDIIRQAVALAEEGAPWVVPHAKVYRQTCQMTDLVLAGAEPSRKRLARQPYDAVAGGGITIIDRATYEAVPIDPEFYDWGGEDIAWAHALTTLVGLPVQLDGDLFHLWHPHPAPDLQKPPESQRLLDAYIAARWHPARMRAALAGTPYVAPEPLPAPRRFRCPTEHRTVRCGPDKARFHRHLFETCDPDLAEALLRMPNVEEVP